MVWRCRIDEPQFDGGENIRLRHGFKADAGDDTIEELLAISSAREIQNAQCKMQSETQGRPRPWSRLHFFLHSAFCILHYKRQKGCPNRTYHTRFRSGEPGTNSI